jgi:hypothetical protein
MAGIGAEAASIVFIKDKNTHTPTGVWVFLMDRWDSNDSM